MQAGAWHVGDEHTTLQAASASCNAASCSLQPQPLSTTNAGHAACAADASQTRHGTTYSNTLSYITTVHDLRLGYLDFSSAELLRVRFLSR